MSELIFHRLDESDMRLFSTWFEDAELRRRIEPPTPRWFAYVSSTPGIYAWMVYDGSIAVGQLQLDTYSDKTGSFALVINAPLRRQGYGKKVLRAFLERPEVKALNRLEATIEPDNAAAVQCCQQVGFRPVSAEPDEEGFLHFIVNPA